MHHFQADLIWPDSTFKKILLPRIYNPLLPMKGREDCLQTIDNLPTRDFTYNMSLPKFLMNKQMVICLNIDAS